MSDAFDFSFNVLNATRVAEHIEHVAERLETHPMIYREVMALLELTEVEHFARLRGRYIRTGATFDSLTEPHGPGAIRDVHRDGAEFGTSVWYAHFLTKAPKDPFDGQVRKEPPGKGLSAVLVFSKTTQGEIGNMVAHYIREPWD